MTLDRMSVRRAGRYANWGLVFALGLVVSPWLSPAPPASALNDSWQVMSGGNSYVMSSGRTFTAPGVPYQYPEEHSAKIHMPNGSARNLRVRVSTPYATAMSGTFELVLRRNSRNTPLACTVDASALASGVAECESLGEATVFRAGDRLSLRADNQLGIDVNYTYTFEFN